MVRFTSPMRRILITASVASQLVAAPSARASDVPEGDSSVGWMNVAVFLCGVGPAGAFSILNPVFIAHGPSTAWYRVGLGLITYRRAGNRPRG